MGLPELKIGDLVARFPIIQGAMGIGVSLSQLAAATANAGGIGTIAGVQIGFNEPDFKTNNRDANLRALKKQIRAARTLSPEGILGVNLMVAMNGYKEMVKTCIEEKIDLIVSGAGLPKDLPELIRGSKIRIGPIVSSGKAAQLIMKLWDKRYDYLPDFLVVEGPEAGGHLAFSEQELTSGPKPALGDILRDVLAVTRSFSRKHRQELPVIAAGGIFNGRDISRYLGLGAAGVQMATRFVGTEECDAHRNFKQVYLDSARENIRIVNSPVGLPGRAIANEFLARLDQGKIPVEYCYRCLRPCNPGETAYCISDALINSVRGNVQEGLVFAGSNAHRVREIVRVKDLIGKLVAEAEGACAGAV